MAFDIEDFTPQAPMGVNAEESFAEGNEDGEMKDGIRGQLPELNPIGKEKRTNKFVVRKRKPTK
jgi:hypothetical protein